MGYCPQENACDLLVVLGKIGENSARESDVIRAAALADTDAILRIWLDGSIKTHDFVPAEFWESRIGDMREVYLPQSEIYVSECDGIVEGFVALRGNTLAALFVAVVRQGNGIGRQLVATAQKVRTSLRLTAYEENGRAIEFYKLCGFRPAGRRIDEHTRHPEVVMLWDSFETN